MAPYHPPTGGRQGKLRLDFNENTVGCSPKVIEYLKEKLTADALTVYPEYLDAMRELAAYFAVAPGELLLSNGTDEAIQVLINTFVDDGDDVLLLKPSYAMYRFYAELAGASVREIDYAPETLAFPLDEFIAAIRPATRAILIANPNNPTGTGINVDAIRRILDAAPDAAVLIDEAYFHFAGETVVPEWRERPNLFASRTFSKVYGMAGLRIGVLMGQVEQMKMLRRASSPYNLNSVALACLPDALADQQYVSNYVSQCLEGRRQLESELAAWNVRHWPSRANFVLMYLGENCKLFIQQMRDRGILVRDRSADYGCKDCVRITVGIREHNQRMLTALREVFADLGITQQVAK